MIASLYQRLSSSSGPRRSSANRTGSLIDTLAYSALDCLPPGGTLPDKRGGGVARGLVPALLPGATSGGEAPALRPPGISPWWDARGGRRSNVTARERAWA